MQTKGLAYQFTGFCTKRRVGVKPQLLEANFVHSGGSEGLGSPRKVLKHFSAVDTQTAVLISTAEVWISAPDTQTPISLGFLGMHSWLWFFFLPGEKNFGYFPEVPVTKSGSQHQLCIQTLPSCVSLIAILNPCRPPNEQLSRVLTVRKIRSTPDPDAFCAKRGLFWSGVCLKIFISWSSVGFVAPQILEFTVFKKEIIILWLSPPPQPSSSDCNNSTVKHRGREKNGGAGYCPKILLPKRANSSQSWGNLQSKSATFWDEPSGWFLVFFAAEYLTLKVKNCIPRNPSSIVQSKQSKQFIFPNFSVPAFCVRMSAELGTAKIKSKITRIAQIAKSSSDFSDCNFRLSSSIIAIRAAWFAIPKSVGIPTPSRGTEKIAQKNSRIARIAKFIGVWPLVLQKHVLCVLFLDGW